MKILQVAYYYPPMGGAGVQRALKFSRYLPEFGVQPIVLAAHDPAYVADASLASEIPPGVAVHRVEHRPLLGTLAQWRRSRGGSAAPPSARPASSAAPHRGSAWRDAALRAYAALQFPDDKAMWARRAERRACEILQHDQVDLVFTSSPPVSAHRLGARLARRFGVPWVADFRDLWTDNPGYAAPAWRHALDRRSETAWLRGARGIVTVTPSWRDMLAQRVDGACPVAFIPNGYDEADFATLAPQARGDRVFRLVHTGTFYGPRDPAALLDGVATYLRSAPAHAPPLRVRLVGNIGARFEATLSQFDVRHPGVVERVAYLPHHVALAELMAADALLLVVGGGNDAASAGWLPGKIFEYLRVGKPVLLLGHEQGDAAELVRRHSSGWVVGASQPERIAQALHAMVSGRDTAAAAAPRDGIARFERRALAGQLAAFLTDCIRAPHGRA